MTIRRQGFRSLPGPSQGIKRCDGCKIDVTMINMSHANRSNSKMSIALDYLKSKPINVTYSASIRTYLVNITSRKEDSTVRFNVQVRNVLESWNKLETLGQKSHDTRINSGHLPILPCGFGVLGMSHRTVFMLRSAGTCPV